MPTGTVKWFDSRKGYGFIQMDDGDTDIFVHYTGIKSQEGEFRTLNEGEKVQFEITEGAKGKQAVDVEKV